MTFRRPLAALASLALALAWTCFVIQPPRPAATGLDSSWQLAITLAARDHLQFGHDVVFTYGPLAYVLFGLAEPRLAASSIALALGLMALVVAGLWTACGRRTPPLQRLALAAVMLLLSANLQFDYVIALGAVALLARASRFPRRAALVGLAVGSIALFGALSKYTLALDVLAAAAATWGTDVVFDARRRRAALLAGGIAAAVVAGGIAAAMHFSLRAIDEYVVNAAAISGGYSAAMTVGGPRRDVALALLVAGAILTLGAAAWRERKFTLAPLAAIVLFLAWKHGFVRQDAHVTFYFGMAAGVAAILGAVVRSTAARIVGLAATAVAVAAFVFVFDEQIGSRPAFFSFERLARGAAYVAAPVATQTRQAAQIPEQLAPDRLPPASLALVRGATVDVLPTETALVAANGLAWDPLPVFQSYSAYTPLLDAVNATALGERGAAFILYDYVAIDGRYPLGEMPATTVALACRYGPALPGLQHVGARAYVVLRRLPDDRCTIAAAGAARDVAVGRAVALPQPASPREFIVAGLRLRPTALTQLATVLWRAPKASVDVRFADGTVRQWRLVVATVGDGVIVAPSPRTPAEAATFFAGGPLPAVRSITVVARPGAYVLDGVTFTRVRRDGPVTAP